MERGCESDEVRVIKQTKGMILDERRKDYMTREEMKSANMKYTGRL